MSGKWDDPAVPHWSTPVLVEHHYNVPLRELYLHLEPHGDLMGMLAVPVLPTLEPPPPTPATPEPATLDLALAALAWLD
jgi:hypothetical protein